MRDGHEPSLYYEVHGTTGPHLLLVHGFLSSGSQWLLNLPALSAVCRPVVVELLGHRRSPTPDDPRMYTPEHYVEQFECIRRALGTERWFVCGQSLGAALTLRYALDYPGRIIGHIFTNSNSAFAEEGWADRVRPMMEAQARALEADGRSALDEHPLNPGRGKRLPEDARNALATDFARHEPRGIALTGLHTIPGSSVRERVGANRVPSVLIVGRREARFAAHRRFAQETMPQLEVVELDAGHAVNLEEAEAFNDAVLAFMERCSVGTTATTRRDAS